MIEESAGQVGRFRSRMLYSWEHSQLVEYLVELSSVAWLVLRNAFAVKFCAPRVGHANERCHCNTPLGVHLPLFIIEDEHTIVLLSSVSTI